MQKPVDMAINEARKRVLDELEGKQCQDKLRDKFVRLFGEITDKASRCNNVAALQNIKIEADALKVRCLNEISTEEAKCVVVPPQSGCVAEETHYGGEVVKQPSPAPVKKKKTVSIKTISNEATWQIENEADVKRYVAELEKKLISSLEDNTIINVEF